MTPLTQFNSPSGHADVASNPLTIPQHEWTSKVHRRNIERVLSFLLPNDHVAAHVAADHIFDALVGSRELFRHGNAVIELNSVGQIAAVTPAALL